MGSARLDVVAPSSEHEHDPKSRQPVTAFIWLRAPVPGALTAHRAPLTQPRPGLLLTPHGTVGSCGK
jgi:hypothetical protein